MSKFKPYLTINVNYEGVNSSFDKKLEQHAKKHHGKTGSSGYCLYNDTRDIGFDFKTVEDAVAFAKAAKRFKNVNTVVSRSVLTVDD